jgi:hypothetical protein
LIRCTGTQREVPGARGKSTAHRNTRHHFDGLRDVNLLTSGR